MRGLELSEAYFEEYGLPMLKNDFPDLLPYLAAGLFGQGSECFGYDDEVSRDHDFEPGFCLFLPGEEAVDRRTAFLLERAYAKLPREFLGVPRLSIQPVGGARHGVFRTEEFFGEALQLPLFDLKPVEWLKLPEQTLAEATNGKVFFDNFGEVTAWRERFSYYPEDVRKKKIACRFLLAAQAGQYNYLRCVRHGETGAAQIAAAEFVRHAMAAVFLLNRKYRPYYKWCFRALRALPRLSFEAELFEYLLTSGNDNDAVEEKSRVIEGICADLIDELKEEDLSDAVCGDLEKHAYSVNDRIEDGILRNLSLFAAE